MRYLLTLSLLLLIRLINRLCQWVLRVGRKFPTFCASVFVIMPMTVSAFYLTRSVSSASFLGGLLSLVATASVGAGLIFLAALVMVAGQRLPLYVHRLDNTNQRAREALLLSLHCRRPFRRDRTRRGRL